MAENKDKISIILPNHLGDVVMATPALRSLRRGFPQAEITAVLRRPLDQVLGGSPRIDRILAHDIYAGGGAVRQFRRRLAVARELRGSEITVVLPNSVSSALLAFSTRAPRRLGYARRGRGLLLSEAVPAPREAGRFVPVAMERYYLDLVGRLGCPDEGTELELFSETEAEAACEALFARQGLTGDAPLVCLAPGAGFGPSKIWPAAYVAEVARALIDDGAKVALVHAPGEEVLADEIAHKTGDEIISLGGSAMNLSLLKSVLSRARLLICNDAGARHISAAFDVPTLVLMGPTSTAYTNLNLKRTRLLREPVDCSPCQKKVCPTDHRCMALLSPARVLKEAREALMSDDWLGSVELELHA
ncbi:MAG: lipopolysaccharide heptosyltransferase II [bacterium]|nr:lipopolysaccharide heptosyltransferase II [bacterium]